MRKKTFFFAGIILCILVSATIGYYLYQKPRSSLVNAKPAYTLSAQDLYNAFQQNEQQANEQYLEKVIQVKGTVDNIQVTDSTMSILLSSGSEMGAINCSISKGKDKKQIAPPQKGSVIQVKGKCIGFLMDVNLVDAVIVNDA